MTDNRTTELRRLLDERGFGYKPTRFSMLQTTFTANGVEWIVTEREATGELFVEPRHGLTPEQAIAATLGSGTGEWVLEHSGTLYDKWRCSKCGYLFVEPRCDQGYMDLEANFCPKCGVDFRKVVGA